MKINLFQHLNNLLEHYLEPLKRETFLSNAEITALFGNIQEIVTFQRQFLQNLDEALELEPDFHKFDHSSQFKVEFFTGNHLKFLTKSGNFTISECIVLIGISILVLCEPLQTVFIILCKPQQSSKSSSSE